MSRTAHDILYRRAGTLSLVIDGVLTLLAWAGFIWLIVTGIIDLMAHRENTPRVALPFMEHTFLASVSTIMVYVFIGVLIMLALVGWSKYNQWRWRGKERRKRFPALDLTTLPSCFGASGHTLEQLQGAKRVTVHSDKHGDVKRLSHIQHERLTSPTSSP